MYRPTLVDRLFIDPNEGGIPDRAALRWLLDRGVHIRDIASPLAVRTTHVRFDANRGYAPNSIGDLAYIIIASDEGGAPSDVAAWAPRTGELGVRVGDGVFLGCPSEPVVAVHATPLEWLRAGRNGVVILNGDRAAVALIGRAIEVANRAHADILEKILRVTAPSIRIARKQAAA